MNETNDTLTKKRFIAGAICPKCHLMDKIVVYTEGETRIASCIRCGYVQKGTESKIEHVAKTKKKRQVIWLGKEAAP